MDHQSFLDFSRDADSMVDVKAIWESWHKLRPPYEIDKWVLPLPLWARRPYSETGTQAWEALCHDFRQAAIAKPLNIYMHIPFCSSKCGFCDSYSFKLVNHQEEHRAAYVEILKREMVLWSRQGDLAQRPVPTVHFGGGTPTFLGPAAFSHVVEECRAYFQTTPDTEWALESNVTHLTSAMLAQLHSLGFRRLHIGVQSLEDPVRAAIGRRGPAHQALARIEEALSLDWIVSVDLICGLPGQTLAGFLNGIKSLAEIGTDGFSLYELLIFPQNRRWAAGYGLTQRSHIPNYLMFEAGCRLLEQLGYRKNLFNHWANSRDDNRYFTFPTRSEDLLAMGTIADGVFGDYHYRHPRYQRYRNSVTSGFPGLEGGLRRTEHESRLQPFSTTILSGHISAEMGAKLATMGTRTDATLLEEWLECGLVKRRPDGSGFSLTATGSWFAGNMILQLESTITDQAVCSGTI